MIRIEGLSLERFLNLAAKMGIKVFDARRTSYTVLRVTLGFYDYKRLENAELDRYSITIEKRGGLPSGLAFLCRRKALLFGLMIVAAAAIAASLFVWDVQITGVEGNEKSAILSELEGYGILAGMYKGDLDTDEIETRMLIDHDEIAWMDIYCKGVRVQVEIVPAEPVPDIVDENTPCNIVASKDAYIESVTAMAGRAAVKMGDTVRKGDVLISGFIWDAGFPRMLFAARGEVIGSVWYTASVNAPIFVQTRQPTGRTQTQRIISIGRDSAALSGGCTFETYDTQVIDVYHIGRILPISITTLAHSEVRVTKTPEDLELLKVYAEEAAYRQAQAKISAEATIARHRTFFDVSDDLLTARVYLQTYENIGKTVYLEE